VTGRIYNNGIVSLSFTEVPIFIVLHLVYFGLLLRLLLKIDFNRIMCILS